MTGRIPPRAADVLAALAAGAAGTALEISDANLATKHIDAPTWVYVLAQLAAAAALLRRRQHPHAVGLAVAAVCLVVPVWAVLLVPYSVTAYGERTRRSWLVVLALVGCWTVGANAWSIADPISAPAVILASALAGAAVRSRRALLAGMVEQARADERARLAAEMHDVVTHRINLIVLQAGALRVTSADEGVRAAAEEMRAAGCQALAELRDVVGVLRHGDPAPGRDADDAPDLSRLVADSRAAGLPVRLAETGDPSGLAPTVRRTVFRVVQESLTNVHKHAPAARVAIDVHYGPQDVRLTVANTPSGRAPDPELAAVGGGTGLDGLRQRVEVVGGRFAAGATEDGGFAVEAALPAYVAAR
ncbi:histidine kinase [Asanoa sp. WMMD1127]|uniref:sensor histidine kinase n=1 Tax=Asanoa sp. WMMD1127 TaxID=3016107 RepID=UPI002417B6BD|nr:histidine kinase [Asanoa sp. WMMD1127]MDG4823214.1 histidine kinase [Asanoa sp. WMMD1127]